MKIINRHERILNARATDVGKLIDGLASEEDKLWPHDRWSRMIFDRPLGVGATGGHGVIGYVVETYEPGRSIWFTFTSPEGFIGGHGFNVEEIEQGKTRLRHVIEMSVTGRALVNWILMIRPLHDALIEDALDRAEAFTGGHPAPRKWSPWVRTIRWTMRRIRKFTKRGKS